MKKPSRTKAVIDHIQSQIARRALLPDEKLPSIRQCAATLGVSPSTVVEAYDRMVAEGLVFARAGAGFYVTGPVAPLALGALSPRLEKTVDPLWVSRQSLDAEAGKLKPGCGWLPPDWMPQAAIRKALRGLAGADAALLTDYGSTQGAESLRRGIARQLAGEGIAAAPEQILLTGSGTQAIDLICRFLLRRGDVVVVDDPCYFNFQALLKAHQVKVVGVPYTANGPDMARFSEVLARHAPRLYLTNSAIHNPTGATMSSQVAHHVLVEAAAHGVVVIEDNIFSGFEPAPSARLAALGGFNQVISIGSFSKSLSAAFRCGYIATQADWIEPLLDLQVATNFGGPSPMAVELLNSVLGEGRYRKHMAALHTRLTRARFDVAAKLAPLGIQPWLMPRGGFYLWCALPSGVDSTEMARQALRQGVVLAPGNVFSVTQTKSRFMRFNVSQMGAQRVYDVLGAAME